MLFMTWVIVMGIVGVVINVIYLFYGNSPYKWYFLFKILCVTYAIVAYTFFMVDKYWYDFSWLTYDNFRYICIRPLVVMLFTWFITDAWLRRWGRWRDM